MNNPTIKRIIISLAVAAVIIITFFSLRFFFTFYISSITPSPNRLPRSSIYIDIAFNKPVEDIGLVKLSPESSIMKSYSIEGKKVRVFVESLGDRDRIALYLEEVTSTDGYTIDNYTAIFTLTGAVTDSLPGDQLDYALEEQDRYTDSDADPIQAVAPHSTLDYKISLDATRTNEDGSQIYDVVIEIFLSNADRDVGREQAIERYKNNALQYLRDSDINPDDYQIRYVIPE